MTKNTPNRMDFNSQFSLLSPKISKASSRIDLSSAKIGQLANATTLVMLDLRLWDAHSVHLPIDVFPT
ncbi:MAG: hypothetical protein ACK480_02470 [Planctomycetota bacterium]|jgi:hypothetical protein